MQRPVKWGDWRGDGQHTVSQHRQVDTLDERGEHLERTIPNDDSGTALQDLLSSIYAQTHDLSRQSGRCDSGLLDLGLLGLLELLGGVGGGGHASLRVRWEADLGNHLGFSVLVMYKCVMDDQ